jgi:hypothetical protein
MSGISGKSALATDKEAYPKSRAVLRDGFAGSGDDFWLVVRAMALS